MSPNELLVVGFAAVAVFLAVAYVLLAASPRARADGPVLLACWVGTLVCVVGAVYTAGH